MLSSSTVFRLPLVLTILLFILLSNSARAWPPDQEYTVTWKYERRSSDGELLEEQHVVCIVTPAENGGPVHVSFQNTVVNPAQTNVNTITPLIPPGASIGPGDDGALILSFQGEADTTASGTNMYELLQSIIDGEPETSNNDQPVQLVDLPATLLTESNEHTELTLDGEEHEFPPQDSSEDTVQTTYTGLLHAGSNDWQLKLTSFQQQYGISLTHQQANGETTTISTESHQLLHPSDPPQPAAHEPYSPPAIPEAPEYENVATTPGQQAEMDEDVPVPLQAQLPLEGEAAGGNWEAAEGPDDNVFGDEGRSPDSRSVYSPGQRPFSKTSGDEGATGRSSASSPGEGDRDAGQGWWIEKTRAGSKRPHEGDQYHGVGSKKLRTDSSDDEDGSEADSPADPQEDQGEKSIEKEPAPPHQGEDPEDASDSGASTGSSSSDDGSSSSGGGSDKEASGEGYHTEQPLPTGPEAEGEGNTAIAPQQPQPLLNIHHILDEAVHIPQGSIIQIRVFPPASTFDPNGLQ